MVEYRTEGDTRLLISIAIIGTTTIVITATTVMTIYQLELHNT